MRGDKDTNFEPTSPEQEITRRQLLERAAALGISASVLPAFLASEAAAWPLAEGQSGGTLNVRTWGLYAGTLDPVEVPSFLEYQTVAPIYEGLLGYKPGSKKAYPLLAQEVEQSKDGKRFKFNLKRGIPFHGGYGEVTAEDVAFSLLRGNAAPANSDGSRGKLRRVRVTGKYSGVIELTTPYVPYMTGSLTRWTAAIVSKRAVQQLGERFKTRPIATGPYQVSEFVPQQGATLTRFRNYEGQVRSIAAPATFNEIVYRVIVQDNAAVIALQSGQLSYAMIGAGFLNILRGDSRYTTYPSSIPGHYVLGMNTQHRLLRNPNLRKAIRWGIDMQQVANGAFEGFNPPDWYLIQHGNPGFWRGTPKYRRDLARAREFFRAGGSPKDPLKIQTLVAPSFKAAAEILAEQLKEVGFNIVVDAGSSPDAQAWRRQNPPSADSAMHFTIIPHGFDPSDWTEPFHSHRIGVNSVCFWDNERYDALWQQATQTLDAKKRKALYEQMQRIFATEMPTSMLLKGIQYYAGKRSLRPAFSPWGFAAYHLFGGTP